MIGLNIEFLPLPENQLFLCVSSFFLRTVEPLSAVKANHLVGCSINEKVCSAFRFHVLASTSL